MDDDFEKAMADVQPLAPSRRRANAAPPERLSPSAEAARRAAALGETDPAASNPLTEGEVPSVEPHAVLSWKQDGVQNGVFERLRTAQYPLAGELDLHGHTVAEARERVYHFLTEQRARGHRAVLIAHGRGERSATPARLKSFLAHWLTELPMVIAFHSALPRQGGTGAVYVLLKKVKDASQPAERPA